MELTSDDRYNSQQTAHNQCHSIHGFICIFIGILVSNLIIANALFDTSVDFATVSKIAYILTMRIFLLLEPKSLGLGVANIWGKRALPPGPNIEPPLRPIHCAAKLSAQCYEREQEAQLMLTTGPTRSAVSRGQQTWYHSTCYI